MDRIPAIRRAILVERSRPAAFGWSVVAVVVPTLVRWSIGVGAPGLTFSTYYPAVLLAALLLGWRWGVGVAVASALIANWLFADHPGVWTFGWDDALRQAMFGLSCAVLILIGEMCRRLVRELEQSKAREQLLNDELLHRVKNLFATVNALATMTARHSPPEQFQQALSGRMRALSRATDLLGVGQKGVCDIERLIDNAIAAFRTSSNFTLEGPNCELPRDACVPLSLALHELCTNATKYGALSSPSGRVRLSWNIGDGLDGSEEGLLTFTWEEEDGPPVSPPTKVGMGTRLLRRQSGLSRVDVEFPPKGVRCEICIEGVAREAPELQPAG